MNGWFCRKQDIGEQDIKVTVFKSWRMGKGRFPSRKKDPGRLAVKYQILIS